MKKFVLALAAMAIQRPKTSYRRSSTVLLSFSYNECRVFILE